MPVSIDASTLISRALKDADVRIVSALPETWLVHLIRMAEEDPAMTLVRHTGTHFDAPVHWVTGKDLPDNACDSIPVARFVGPACVIDVTSDVRQNPDFLLTPSTSSRGSRGTGGFRQARGCCCARAGAVARIPRRS